MTKYHDCYFSFLFSLLPFISQSMKSWYKRINCTHVISNMIFLLFFSISAQKCGLFVKSPLFHPKCVVWEKCAQSVGKVPSRHLYILGFSPVMAFIVQLFVEIGLQNEMFSIFNLHLAFGRINNGVRRTFLRFIKLTWNLNLVL